MCLYDFYTFKMSTFSMLNLSFLAMKITVYNLYVYGYKITFTSFWAKNIIYGHIYCTILCIIYVMQVDIYNMHLYFIYNQIIT